MHKKVLVHVSHLKINELPLITQVKFSRLSRHAIVPGMSMVIVVNDMSLLRLVLKGVNLVQLKQ